MNKKKIIVLLGSTKAGSNNQKIVAFFAEKTQDCFDVETLQIDTLPFFNPDLETENTLPKEVIIFKEKVNQADGVLIVTPEYVFSIPGILKNALEWTVSSMIFDEKPTAIITAAASGKIAHESIQLIIKTIGGAFDEKTVLLIQSPKSKINDVGEIINAETLQEINDLIDNFKQTIL